MRCLISLLLAFGLALPVLADCPCTGAPVCVCAGTADCSCQTVGARVEGCPELLVYCAPDSIVVINGSKTKQTGAVRLFSGPPGTKGTYEIRCVCGEKMEKKTVRVTPGTRASVVFSCYRPAAAPVYYVQPAPVFFGGGGFGGGGCAGGS